MKEIIAISSMAGIIGTGLGGILGVFFGNKAIGKTLSFTGGIMIGIVFFDLMPLSLSLSDVFVASLSFLTGVFLVALLDSIFNQKENNSSSRNTYISAGILLLISMAIHNFFEGLAIGSSGAEDLRLGFLVATVIAIHDIPEGMAIAAPLTAGKMTKKRVICLTVFSGLSTIAGAVLGNWLGTLSFWFHALCLGFAGGAMAYVVYGELLPDALISTSKRQNALFTAAGIIVSLLILRFFV